MNKRKGFLEELKNNNTQKTKLTSSTRNRLEELELELDNLSVLIIKEQNKLLQTVSRDDIMQYLTKGVREISPNVFIELLVHKVTLWDDHIEIEFNYSDKANPDGLITARRDFSISKPWYTLSATNCVLIAQKSIVTDESFYNQETALEFESLKYNY